MCLIFTPPDDGWSCAVDGGRELIVNYPSDLPYSTNWLPDDEGTREEVVSDARA